MSISLTEQAAQQVARQLSKRGGGLGLRLGVRKSGCSGYSYVLDYADVLSENDTVFEYHGVKVIIDEEHLPYLDGLQVDYAREGINAAFRFHNPRAQATCGCGESFSI
ncbi:iron-sulfur cluster assembly accessory protein [Candidatus Methylospira mobilis]|uniref:HesB/IscA family protein n=1 Tax=Candidatus Methylospira mobilis TaxID=1808979 RepID=UPI0028EE63B6|nr:iron-sulfur cluster assembly accessory protein [Candidatus Methylospira mobilis]WNV06237.1 iron-sulfur cluster assembly accessory protein [Candidatus Methylospira mobilis]